jgi:hypothetical protein
MSASWLRKVDVFRLSARVAAYLTAHADASKSGLRSSVSVKHDTTVTSMNVFRCKKRQERLVPNIVLGTIVGKRDLCGQAYNGEHWYIRFSRVTMLVLWVDVETY